MVYDEKQKERIYKYRALHRDSILEDAKKNRERKHRALVTLLGDRCILCNREENQTPLIIHEIHGNAHSANPEYIITHKEDFVLLCRPHHAMIHRMKNEGVLAELIKLAKGLLGL